MKRLRLLELLIVFALVGGSGAMAQGPANDQYADRLSVSGPLPVSAPGSTVGATAEPDEPDHAIDSGGNAASNSVWYSWVATFTGRASFSAQDGDFDAAVAVYSGASLESLTLEGWVDRLFGPGPGSPPVTETAVASVVEGVSYSIAVDGYSTTAGVIEPGGEGSFTLVIDQIPTPANDDFSNAVVMPAALPSLDDSGTTSGASAEAGEPDHAFEDINPAFPGNRASNSVWYRWTATSDGTVVASAGNPELGLDLVIAVYTGGTVATLNKVGGGDAFGEGGRESVVFDAVGGTTYAIAVDMYTVDPLPVEGGDFSIIISGVPANDQFAQRLNLGASLPVLGVAGSTLGASAEPGAGEPEHSFSTGNVASSSVWYAWTAPQSALVGVNVASDQADTVIGVYTGDSLAGQVELATADRKLAPIAERAVFDCVAGTEYLIAVDAYTQDAGRRSGSEGLFELDIYVVPPNDDLSGAEDLFDLALPQVRSGTTLNASSEFAIGEPDHAFSIGGNFSSNSVWYRWTATADETVTARISGYSFDGVLAVYSSSGFVEVGASDRVGDGVDEEVRFEVLAGEEYLIAVDVYSADGSDAGGGPFTLELRVAGPAGPFDLWIAGYPGLTGVDATRDGNPSGDGISNLVKLVLGLDPTVPLAEDPMRGNFPQLTSSNGGPALRYTIEPGNLGVGPSAIQHGGQLSTDLGTWIDSAAIDVGGNTWVIEIDPEGADARYGRLKVTDPAG